MLLSVAGKVRGFIRSAELAGLTGTGRPRLCGTGLNNAAVSLSLGLQLYSRTLV